jgi:hypothetical protein
VILVRKLEVMAGRESSGTMQKWRLRLFGKPKAPETSRPLDAQDDVAKLAQAIELTTEYCEWIQGLVNVFQTLFNRAKAIYTASRESNSANDSDVPKQIAELLRLGCQIAQDCGHARKDIARWASFLLSTQLLADTHWQQVNPLSTRAHHMNGSGSSHTDKGEGSAAGGI